MKYIGGAIRRVPPQVVNMVSLTIVVGITGLFLFGSDRYLNFSAQQVKADVAHEVASKVDLKNDMNTFVPKDDLFAGSLKWLDATIKYKVIRCSSESTARSLASGMSQVGDDATQGARVSEIYASAKGCDLDNDFKRDATVVATFPSKLGNVELAYERVDGEYVIVAPQPIVTRLFECIKKSEWAKDGWIPSVGRSSEQSMASMPR